MILTVDDITMRFGGLVAVIVGSWTAGCACKNRKVPYR